MISQLRGLSRPERWRGWQSANFLWPMAISMSNCLPQSTLWKVLNSKFQVRCKIDVFEAKKNKIRNELFVTSLYKLFLSLLRQYFPTHYTHFNFDQDFSKFHFKGAFHLPGRLGVKKSVRGESHIEEEWRWGKGSLGLGRGGGGGGEGGGGGGATGVAVESCRSAVHVGCRILRCAFQWQSTACQSYHAFNANVKQFTKIG